MKDMFTFNYALLKSVIFKLWKFVFLFSKSLFVFSFQTIVLAVTYLAAVIQFQMSEENAPDHFEIEWIINPTYDQAIFYSKP